MRLAAVALVGLSGCQLILGLDDPQRRGDDASAIDATSMDGAAAGDASRTDAPGAPDGAPVDGAGSDGTGWDAASFDAMPPPPDAMSPPADAMPPPPDAMLPPPDAMPPPPGMCYDGPSTRAIVPVASGQLRVNELMPDPSLVADVTGEWVELEVLATFDLNGARLGNGAVELTFTDSTCLRVTAGSFLLVAASANPADNGGLPTVDDLLPFALPNTSGRVEVRGTDGTLFHFVDYAGAVPGRSFIVIDPNVCSAPAGTPSYNGTDVGTPRQVNVGSCP